MQILRTRKRPGDGMQPLDGVATLIVILHAIAAGVIARRVCLQ